MMQNTLMRMETKILHVLLQHLGLHHLVRVRHRWHVRLHDHGRGGRHRSGHARHTRHVDHC